MKKISRRSFLTACAAVAGTAALTACGGSGDSSATAASSGKPTKMFDTTSFSLSSGQMSWYFITSYQLILTGSDTYELNYNLNIFGAETALPAAAATSFSAANTPPPLLRMVKSLMSITASKLPPASS